MMQPGVKQPGQTWESNTTWDLELIPDKSNKCAALPDALIQRDVQGRDLNLLLMCSQKL